MMLRLHWFAHWADKKRIPFVPQLVKYLNRIIFSVVLPPSVKVGKGAFFSYSGLGTIINGESVIGKNCFLGPHVVLGGKHPLPGAPCLEENVVVHAGAKIIGGITVGRNAVIGANSVVLKDVEPGTLVVGVPAKALKTEIDIRLYNPLLSKTATTQETG